MKKIKKAGIAVLMAAYCLGLSTSQSLAEEKPTADLTMGVYSKYVWRGFELSQDSLVLQPSMTVAYKGFSANLWGNLDTDNYSSDTSNWTETDMTLTYEQTVGPVDLSGGYIYYGLDGAADTQEVYASACWNTLLSPTLSVYRDFDTFPGWYITLGVSHSLPVTDKLNLDLGAHIAYLSADEASSYAANDGSTYSAFHDGLLSASMTFPINKYIAITPQLNYSFPLSSDAKDLIKSTNLADQNGNKGNVGSNFVYGGVSASMDF